MFLKIQHKIRTQAFTMRAWGIIMQTTSKSRFVPFYNCESSLARIEFMQTGSRISSCDGLGALSVSNIRLNGRIRDMFTAIETPTVKLDLLKKFILSVSSEG